MMVHGSVFAGRMARLACLLVLLGATTAPLHAADTDLMIARIRSLSDVSLLGRGNGSPQAAAAADSIARWMAAAGLRPPAGPASRFRDFELGGVGFEGLTGRNVLGWLPGRGSLADEIVVVGAHYDHLGADGSVDADGRPVYYPGAEDNASGIAVMLQLAADLETGDGETPRRGCLFIAFAGEEIGLQGSAAFVGDPVFPLERVAVMLNIDSVGRLRGGRLYVGGLGSSPDLRALVRDANAEHGLDLELSDSGWDASDHVSFNAAGVPVVFLFTGPHPEYHSPRDTWDLIPVDGLARVASYASDLLAGLLFRPEPLPYTADGALPRRHDPGPRRKRAWLGTIPDFLENVQGVKLAGVMPDSPAAEAGLAKGDIIIGFGDMEISSLSDLTVALQTHREGEAVRIRFRRGEVERILPITLRKRPD